MNPNNHYENDELDLIDLLKKLVEFTIQYKKIIILSFITLTIIGGVVGIKLDKRSRYYKQNITFSILDTKLGRNPDNTRFDQQFIINKDDNLVVTPVIPEEIKTFILNRLKLGIVETYIPKEYSVSTKPGIYTDESKTQLQETIEQNITIYREEQLPQSKLVLEPIEKEILGDMEYIQRMDILSNRLEEYETQIANLKEKGFKIPKEEEIILSEKIEEAKKALDLYSAELIKNSYVKNLEKFKKSYETKMINLDSEIKNDRLRIPVLAQVIEALKIQKEHIPDARPVEDKNYERTVNEFVTLSLTQSEKEAELAFYREYYKNVKEPSKDTATKLENQEQLVINEINNLREVLIPILTKNNDLKREELVTVGEPVLVIVKNWKKYLMLGAILGLMLGYVLGFAKEFIKIWKSEKTK